jgi:hypothetical protein
MLIKNIDWVFLQKQKKTVEKLFTKLPVLNEDINDLRGPRVNKRICLSL